MVFELSNGICYAYNPFSVVATDIIKEDDEVHGIIAYFEDIKSEPKIDDIILENEKDIISFAHAVAVQQRFNMNYAIKSLCHKYSQDEIVTASKLRDYIFKVGDEFNNYIKSNYSKLSTIDELEKLVNSRK